MSKKSIKTSFLICLFLSFQTVSLAGDRDTFVKFFHINSENLQKVFDEDTQYWNNKKQNNLRSYFKSDIFSSLKETFFRDETVKGLEKEQGDMDEDTKKKLFITYCKIIEKCCFSEPNLLSEEDTRTKTRSIKIERSKIKDLFSEYKKSFPEKHAEILLTRAFSHSLTYLLCEEKIRNPYQYVDIKEVSIQKSIDEINKSQEEKNYKKFEKKVYIPNAMLKPTKNAVIKDATDGERYKTIAKLISSPIDHIRHPKKTSLLALELFDKMWRQKEAEKPEREYYAFVLESQYVQTGVHQGLTASSFDPRALYGVLSYILDNTAETKFKKRAPFKTFYDPCGGWGERFFAAALSNEDSIKNFKTIKVNDLNHDLKEGYEKLEERYKKFCTKNNLKNLKNITFTYEDALKNESNQGTETNDFIFTGLPFFNQERYPNMLEAWTTKGPRKVGEYAFQKWLTEWTAPLIEKLIESLSPGGILAFNIGNRKDMPLANKLRLILNNSNVFKNNITAYTKSLWRDIIYGFKKEKDAYSRIIILQKKMHNEVDPERNPIH